MKTSTAVQTAIALAALATLIALEIVFPGMGAGLSSQVEMILLGLAMLLLKTPAEAWAAAKANKGAKPK